MLDQAQSIYALYHTVDRYYPRFLYTSLFYEIVTDGNKERIQELIATLENVLSASKDQYDKAQFMFLTALFYFLESQRDPTLLNRVEAPLQTAINLNKSLHVPLELLEAECLYNLLEEAKGNGPKYHDKHNAYTDRWSEYVEQKIRQWRQQR